MVRRVINDGPFTPTFIPAVVIEARVTKLRQENRKTMLFSVLLMVLGVSLYVGSSIFSP